MANGGETLDKNEVKNECAYVFFFIILDDSVFSSTLDYVEK